MSEIRVDTIKAEDGISAPSFPSGVSVTGVITATSLQQSVSGEFTAGSLKVGNNIQVGNAGIVTATTFHGSGANLTGIIQSFTNTAIFQYSHNSSFRSYSSEISFGGSPNNAQVQFNMVFDAGDILAASGSNYFSVNTTGYYVAQTHWTSHQPAHFRWPYLYNRTDSKAVGAPVTGNAMNSLTTTQHNMVCYQTGQGGGSTFGESYYLETGKDYDWRYSSDGGENSFGTGTSYLSGSHTNGGVTQQNVIFRAQLTLMGV